MMGEGPRPDAYHRREIPEHVWTTCNGCPAFRVFDFHYFYCRRLGDQSKPDAWNAGWKRLGGMTWNEERQVPCALPEVASPSPTNPLNPEIG